LHSLDTDYYRLLDFLQKIESSPRLMQVGSLNISPDSNNPNLLTSVDLTVNIYLKASTSK
jgi:hypothetical protein